MLASWHVEPTVALGIAISGALYVAGWQKLKGRAGGRATPAAWRAAAFAGGLLALALAVFSPLAAFSALFFFVHMTQHLLLVLVAAPLLILGAPMLPLMWGLPESIRLAVGRLLRTHSPLREVFGLLTNPMVSATLYVGAIALWHLPGLYDAAQGRSAVHEIEHGVFLGTALLYWWPVIYPTPGRRKLSYAAAMAYLAPSFFEGNLIGALLTFADKPLYQTYIHAPRLWGVSVLLDQQLAGLIMWVPGGFFYFIPIIALFMKLMGQAENKQVPITPEPLLSAPLGAEDGQTR